MANSVPIQEARKRALIWAQQPAAMRFEPEATLPMQGGQPHDASTQPPVQQIRPAFAASLPGVHLISPMRPNVSYPASEVPAHMLNHRTQSGMALAQSRTPQFDDTEAIHAPVINNVRPQYNGIGNMMASQGPHSSQYQSYTTAPQGHRQQDDYMRRFGAQYPYTSGPSGPHSQQPNWGTLLAAQAYPEFPQPPGQHGMSVSNTGVQQTDMMTVFRPQIDMYFAQPSGRPAFQQQTFQNTPVSNGGYGGQQYELSHTHSYYGARNLNTGGQGNLMPTVKQREPRSHLMKTTTGTEKGRIDESDESDDEDAHKVDNNNDRRQWLPQPRESNRSLAANIPANCPTGHNASGRIRALSRSQQGSGGASSAAPGCSKNEEHDANSIPTKAASPTALDADLDDEVDWESWVHILGNDQDGQTADEAA